MSAPRRTYRLGLRIGRAWARRPYVAERLWQGSAILWRSLGDRIADRIARTRRSDLTGVAAALGPIVGFALLTGLALALYLIVRSRPWLMWLLTGAWLWCAWRAGKNAVPAPTEVVTERAATPGGSDGREKFIRHLEQLTRGRAGIHLGELHQHLTQQSPTAHLKKSDVRTLLNRYGIPLQRTLRVDGVAGRSGVPRKAVLELMQAAGLTPAPVAESGHSPGSVSTSDLRSPR